jgi:hypothetical protein
MTRAAVEPAFNVAALLGFVVGVAVVVAFVTEGKVVEAAEAEVLLALALALAAEVEAAVVLAALVVVAGMVLLMVKSEE